MKYKQKGIQRSLVKSVKKYLRTYTNEKNLEAEAGDIIYSYLRIALEAVYHGYPWYFRGFGILKLFKVRLLERPLFNEPVIPSRPDYKLEIKLYSEKVKNCGYKFKMSTEQKERLKEIYNDREMLSKLMDNDSQNIYIRTFG